MNVFVTFLIMFVPILLFFGIIDFFSYRNWTTVYTALNDENYFRAVSKLKQAGIRYKAKSLFNQTITPMFGEIDKNDTKFTSKIKMLLMQLTNCIPKGSRKRKFVKENT